MSDAEDGNVSFVPAVICPEPPDSVTINCLLTEKLVSVMKEVYAKVGFHVPASFNLEEDVPAVKTDEGSAAGRYFQEAKNEEDKLGEAIKKAQLGGFKAAFA